MRRIALALLISLCLCSPSIANDKALHFIAGGLASYAGQEDGLLWAGVAGICKEAVDELNGGEADPMDLLATLAGGAAVQLAKYGHLRVSDEFLRFASWSLSGISCASVANQQRDGLREINPALTAITGEHPSFGQVALINLGWGIGAEYAYHHWGKGYGRAMWLISTGMAAYWIAKDHNNGVNPGEWEIRTSWVIARF